MSYEGDRLADAVRVLVRSLQYVVNGEKKVVVHNTANGKEIYIDKR